MHELIEGSRLVVVKGAPHGLNWTHAAELNHALLDFLKIGAAHKKSDSIDAKPKGRR
jgi:hypothetical protein